MELLVLRGDVLLKTGGEALRIRSGHLVRLREGRPFKSEPVEEDDLMRRLTWQDGDAPWQELWAGSLSGVGGEAKQIRQMLPPCGRFMWTATLKRTQGGFLEILLPTGHGQALTLGELPQLGDGKEHTLTLYWGLAPALLLDGHQLREFPPSNASGQIGLGVTNGRLEVLHWRWRPLP